MSQLCFMACWMRKKIKSWGYELSGIFGVVDFPDIHYIIVL
jgi:hypothetical protein